MRDARELASCVIDVPLSVLDVPPVAAGTPSGQAWRKTPELARRTEELGYRRFWVAEHHNMPAIASSAPAVLIAHLAAATSTIRVGSGGVMLPNHAPLVVAEQFGTLEALHPGRIDLGIGRAPGTDHLTALALPRTMEARSAVIPTSGPSGCPARLRCRSCGCELARRSRWPPRRKRPRTSTRPRSGNSPGGASLIRRSAPRKPSVGNWPGCLSAPAPMS